MDIENEMKSQPIATTETPAEIPNSSNNTLYQSILAEPLLTTVQCYATSLITAAKALAYLTQNCWLTDAVLRIGFSDRTLGSLLPNLISENWRLVRTSRSTSSCKPNSQANYRRRPCIATCESGEQPKRNWESQPKRSVAVGLATPPIPCGWEIFRMVRWLSPRSTEERGDTSLQGGPVTIQSVDCCGLISFEYA